MTLQVIRCETDDEWRAERRKSVGCSEVAGLFGIHPYQSAQTIYAGKVLGEERPMSEVMKWGVKLERPIAEYWAEEYGWRIDSRARVIYRDSRWPWLHATLDFVATHISSREGCVLEVKNVGASRAREWKEAAPAYYALQLQGQLGITDHKRGHFAACLGGNALARVPAVDFNQRAFDEIVAASAYFWNTYIVPRVEPPNGWHRELPTEFCPAKESRPARKSTFPVITTE